MKTSISPAIMVAVIVVVVVAIAGIGFMLFAPKKESQAERDAFFATHPDQKKAADSMRTMSENTGNTPPPGVNIRRGSPSAPIKP